MAAMPPPFVRFGNLWLVRENGLFLEARGTVDDARVTAGIEERFAVVLPPHAIVLVSGGPQNLEDLARATGLADVLALDLDQVADLSMLVVIAHPNSSWVALR
jgi:hypothetical protein